MILSNDGKILTKVDNSDIKEGQIEVPVNVTLIGQMAFYGCANLSKVTLPVGVTRINFRAFIYCTNLSQVTLPVGVETIGVEAFRYCANLSQITLPVGVKTIGDEAFGNCTKLSQITLPAGVTRINRRAFKYCANLSQITLPVGVETIGDEAFGNCTKLSQITLPVGVTTIGERAFYGCAQLEKIFIDSPTKEEGEKVQALLPKNLQNKVVIGNFALELKNGISAIIPLITGYHQGQLLYFGLDFLSEVFQYILPPNKTNDSKKILEALSTVVQNTMKERSISFENLKEVYCKSANRLNSSEHSFFQSYNGNVKVALADLKKRASNETGETGASHETLRHFGLMK